MIPVRRVSLPAGLREGSPERTGADRMDAGRRLGVGPCHFRLKYLVRASMNG